MYLEADYCLYMNRRAIVKVFVWLDLLTVLAQLAGTALQATFGDLIRIGIIVGDDGSCSIVVLTQGIGHDCWAVVPDYLLCLVHQPFRRLQQAVVSVFIVR
jgi:hypothetical protein